MKMIDLDLQAGIAAQRAGNIEQARACYLRVLEGEPRHQAALLRLSAVLPSTEHALLCIDQLLTINPAHTLAREARDVLLVRLMLEEAALIPASAPIDPNIQRPRRLGELLTAAGILSYRQLEQALVEQARLEQLHQRLRLGEVLLRMGMLQPEQLSNTLARQIQALPAANAPYSRLRIGDYLVQQGWVTQQHLERALVVQRELAQKRIAARIGDVLVRCGFLQQQQLNSALLGWPQAYAAQFQS